MKICSLTVIHLQENWAFLTDMYSPSVCVCLYVCVYMHIYIYIYIQRERERGI
jgi:hypothetical protein